MTQSKLNSYTLTRDAENDLLDIAKYTLSKWGKSAFDKYKNGLEETFVNISNGNVIPKSFSKNIPDIRVTKYKYHFIFYLVPDRERNRSEGKPGLKQNI